MMRRVWWIGGSLGMLLGSAAPPPFAKPAAPPAAPRLAIACVTACAPAETTGARSATPTPETLVTAPAATPPAPKPPAAKPSRGRGVRIVVSLPLQRAYVFRNGELLATSPVSTGRRGYETPAGTFPILQKRVDHRSSLYDDAPMPYMQRLTWSGVALHAGAVPGYRASHGCIRLPRKFAKTLYGLTDYGTIVTVTKARPKTAKQALWLS